MNDDEQVRQRLWSFAKRLIGLTEQRLVAWSTSDDPDSFLYFGQNATVLLSKETYEDDGPPRSEVKFSLLSGSGTKIGVIWETIDIEQTMPAPWRDDLQLLYEAARRSANKELQVLDAFDLELRSLDEPF